MANPTTPKEQIPTIKTPQELIHIKHKITLLQYKLWILGLRAYRDAFEASPFGLEQDEMCYVPMSELEKHLGYQPKTGDLEDDLETIRIEPIVFNILEKDREKAKTGVGFISTWYVSSYRIGVTFPATIRQAIEQLGDRDKLFSLLNWAVFNSFSGKHEAVLYKMCKDYVRVRRTKVFTIQEYRDYMGIKEHEYPDFKRLNQWVISGPIKAINSSEHSDIRLSVKFGRENRRVTTVQFFIEPVAHHNNLLGDSPAFEMARISIPLAQQRQYLELFSEELIVAAIARANDYADSETAKGKPVQISAIYRTAIEEGWGAEETIKPAAPVLEEVVDNTVLIEKLKADFKSSLVKQTIDTLALSDRRDYLTKYAESPKRVGSTSSLDPETTVFGDKHEANQFKSWLRTEIKPNIDEAAFSTWLVQVKKLDPITFTPLQSDLT